MQYGSDFSAAFTEGYQLQILAGFLRVRRAMQSVMPILEPHYFPETTQQNITRVAREHFQKHNIPPTRAEVEQALHKDGLLDDKAQNTLKQVYRCRVGSVDGLVENVREFALTMAYARATIQASQLIERGQLTDINALFESARKAGDISQGDWLSVSQVTQEELDRMVRSRMIPLGNAIMNDAMSTPRLGHLIVLMAPQKTGKTTGLINFGYWHATALPSLEFPQQNVAYFSNEIEAPYIVDRFRDRFAGDAVLYKHDDRDKYVEAVQKKMRMFQRGGLFVRSYPNNTLTNTMIRAELDNFEAEGIDIHVVCIDYADIMRPEGSHKDALEAEASIYAGLRATAVERRKLIYTASQLGRQAHGGERNGMKDVAGTIKKAGIMDGAVVISRSDDDRARGIIKLELTGFRNVADGLIVECEDLRDRAAFMPVRVYTPAPAKDRPQRPAGDGEDRGGRRAVAAAQQRRQ